MGGGGGKCIFLASLVLILVKCNLIMQCINQFEDTLNYMHLYAEILEDVRVGIFERSVGICKIFV